MTILIAGAGGVGLYYGGLLAQANNDVVFLARGANLKALQQKGLTLRDKGKEVVLPIKTLGPTTPRDPFSVRLVLLTAKAYSTKAILDNIRDLIGPDTLFLSLQNGIGVEAVIQEAFPDNTVLGGLCYLGAKVVAPGIVEQTAQGHIVFGALSDENVPAAQEVAALFEGAGIPYKLSQNIILDKWMKFGWNVPFNQLCAVSGLTVAELLAVTEFEQAVRAMIEEVRRVAHASGVILPETLADTQIRASKEKFGALHPSLSKDLKDGKPTEHASFGGYMVNEGTRLGVSTPLNRAVFAFLDSDRAKNSENRNPNTLHVLLSQAQIIQQLEEQGRPDLVDPLTQNPDIDLKMVKNMLDAGDFKSLETLLGLTRTEDSRPGQTEVTGEGQLAVSSVATTMATVVKPG